MINSKENLRIAAAKSSRRPRELDQLSRDLSSRVRLAVAQNANTEEHTLHDLRFDNVAAIRAAVCRHWLVLPETIGALLGDTDRDVREAAWSVWDARLLAIVLGADALGGPVAEDVKRLLGGVVRDCQHARALLAARGLS